VKIEKQKNGPQTGAPVTVQFIGKDFDELARISQKAYGRIQGVPNLVNLRNDYEATRPELAFRTDRTRAAMLGLNSNVIGNYLRTALWGTKVGTYRELNDEYDITVRLPGDRRTDIDDLFQRSVPGPGGSAVPLSSLGTFDYQGGMGTINRLNQKRVVTLTADNEGRQPDEVLKDVQECLAPLGRNKLIPADILDWKAFCALLEKTNDTPTGQMARSLSGDARKIVVKGMSSNLTGDEKATLLAELYRPGIFGLFQGVLAKRDFVSDLDLKLPGLSEEAVSLAKQDRKQLSGDELGRLNRLVVEAAAPGVVAKSVKFEVPPGYEVRYAGEREEQEKAMAFLGKAFIMALLLIFLVLVAEFNTLSVPVIIMSTVVLSMIGVLIGLLVAGLPFSVIMTGVGAISLTGVVVANGIVLLDFVRALQRRGLSVVDAAIQASVVRLRPVFLTAITAILGLLPMATGVSFDFHHLTWSLRSESSQFWASMAIAVIYGLTFATVLTLVIVPALYVMIYRQLAKAGLGGLHKLASEEEAAPITLPPPIPKA
jgi:multidrug efflux pump subunit AcrB